MPRRGENIRKRKDGRWEARYPSGTDENGKKIYTSVYAESYREVKEKRNIAIQQMHTPSNERVVDLQFKDILHLWLENNKIRLKESTVYRYSYLIESHILPELGNIWINSMNSSTINSFLANKARCGRLDGQGGLSASYTRSIMLIINSALRFAVDNKICEPVCGRISKPPIKPQELSVLSISDQEKLENILLNNMDETKLGIYISLYTGLRIGEICALSWEDIDLSNRLMHVRHSATTATAPYLGLFGCVSGSSAAYASVKNVTLDGTICATSTGSVANAYIGGLMGSAAFTNVENVISNVDITIQRIKGNWAGIGGIAGQITYGTVTNCGNEGDISGYQYVGGIAGKLASSGTVTGCYNSGDISGSAYAAGLVASNACTLTASYNTGKVTATATNSYVGGIAGINTGASAVITNCFTTGMVSGGTSYAGGAIGRVNNASCVVSNVNYLESAYTTGIGAVAGTQAVSAVSADMLASAAFAETMNEGLETAAFKAGTDHPVLVWQTVEETVRVEFGRALHNLSLQDLIKIGYAFTINADNTTDRGVVILTDDHYTGDMEITVDTEGVQVKTLTASGSYWTAQSDGIYSQRLDTVHYARPYVVIDGTYYYGDVDEYSVLKYAESVFAQTGKEKLKQCMVDLLNYGTAAQIYLAELNGEDVPGTLINDMLSEDQKVMGWNDELKQYAPELTKDTAGDLNAVWKGSNLSLLDAICMNLAATGDVDGMYYWTAEDYKAATVLNATTASGTLITKGDGSYTIGTVSGIAAKNIADVHYVCAYNDSGTYGPVRADSVAIYATKLVDNKEDGSAESNIAKALLVYGESARVYLASLNGG